MEWTEYNPTMKEISNGYHMPFGQQNPLRNGLDLCPSCWQFFSTRHSHSSDLERFFGRTPLLPAWCGYTKEIRVFNPTSSKPKIFRNIPPKLDFNHNDLRLAHKERGKAQYHKES